MAPELPGASLIEGIRFTAQAMVPNVVQGLFRRRSNAVRVATRLDVDGQAVGLIDGIRRSHGAGPVWVRVARERMLLALATDDIRRVLDGSPTPFAPDPEAKRKGMGHFQPDALTISRGEQWRKRRRFAEAVLDTGEPVHGDADRFAQVIAEEIAELIAVVEGTGEGELGWEPWSEASWRITRRIVLGDAARDDHELTEALASMMAAANGMPEEPSDRLGDFLARIREYIGRGEGGSLVGRFGEIQADDEVKVDRQATHWLFAMGDTLAANAFRALAAIASHPWPRAEVEAEVAAAANDGGLGGGAAVASLDYLGACLQDAMRLWPTTPFLSRETLEQTEWGGEKVPAGTQILISNTFNHRDRERHDFADRFAPEAWTEGDAEGDWSFNHLSHGPQGCPGAGLAIFVGQAMLANLLCGHKVRQANHQLDPDKPLPHMLDFFSLKFEVSTSST